MFLFNRGGIGLFDNLGHKLTDRNPRRKNPNPKSRTWRCTKRNLKNLPDYPGSVKVIIDRTTGESTYTYHHHHTCKPIKDLVMKVAMNRQAKIDAVENK